jgi:hypothetical protein
MNKQKSVSKLSLLFSIYIEQYCFVNDFENNNINNNTLKSAIFLYLTCNFVSLRKAFECEFLT